MFRFALIGKMAKRRPPEDGTWSCWHTRGTADAVRAEGRAAPNTPCRVTVVLTVVPVEGNCRRIPLVFP